MCRMLRKARFGRRLRPFLSGLSGKAAQSAGPVYTAVSVPVFHFTLTFAPNPGSTGGLRDLQTPADWDVNPCPGCGYNSASFLQNL